MRQRAGIANLSSSPVLVGAVTLLVTIVAVFLSYNANSGLPFVPTYDLKANLPNAANLVKGNEVRIGGARVGVIKTIDAVPSENGDPTARLDIALDNDLNPLPVDSTFVVRSRSALGLKYVELTPGESKAGYPAGSSVPVRAFTPEPVEIDEVFNTFDERARIGSRRSLQGFGSGFAGRGQDLNDAIREIRPLLENLEPVASNLADQQTQLARLFRSLQDTAQQVAPVAETQAALFGNMATTFRALAGVAPYLQEFISESPPTFETGIAEFPKQRPFLRNSAAFFRELRPGIRTLPASAPVLAQAFEFGTRNLPRTPPLNRRLAEVFDALADFSDDPQVPRAIRRLASTAGSLRRTVGFLTPVQTKCNYVTLFFRNVASHLSEGDGNGTWQRFIIVSPPVGPNDEGGPSDRPANGPQPSNYLHSNPSPNTASPGQTEECEAGNEDFILRRVITDNVPGNQGLKTTGQGERSRPATQADAP